MTPIKETKLFSAAIKDKLAAKALRAGSVSTEDAAKRAAYYASVFANFEGYKETVKTFSGYTETNALTNQYFNATVASYLNSFAGFLSIERAMDQPNMLLSYLDVLGVSDGRTVLPNLGAENLNGIRGRVTLTIPTLTTVSTYNTTLNKKLIPGSLNIKVVIGANTYTITDDRQGNLVSTSGVLAGTPTQTGTFSLIIKVTDKFGVEDTFTDDLVISA
jgi:hypothetical protein